jgi:FkbM family methyltransferase
MKYIRLAIAAVLAGALSVGVLVLANRHEAYSILRCWRLAPNPLYCHSNRPFDFTADYFGFRWEGNTGNMLDSYILRYGAPERQILYFFRDVMQRISPGPQGIFVDVGANVGTYSLFMSRYTKEVHAFEPYEPAVAKFRRMVEINRVQNIKIHPVGLGDKHAKLPFFKPPDKNQGIGSFMDGLFKENTKYHELEILVGDEALQAAGVPEVEAIKIDVEGYEKPVLAGLRQTLIKSRPVVHFELTTKATSSVSFRSMEEIVNAFPPNYKFFVICASGEGKCEHSFTDRYELTEPGNINFQIDSQRDMIAYPAEREGQIPHSGPE